MVTSISLAAQLVQEGLIFLLASLLVVGAWEHYHRGRAHRTGWSSRRSHQHTIDATHQHQPKAWPRLRCKRLRLADVVTSRRLSALVRITTALLLLCLIATSLFPAVNVLMGPLSPSRMAHSIYHGMELALAELFGVGITNKYVYKATAHPLMDDLAGLLETYSLLPAKLQIGRTQRDQAGDAGRANMTVLTMPMRGLMWEIDWLIREACEIDDLEWKGTARGSGANDNSPCRDKSFTSAHMGESSWVEFEVQMNLYMPYGSTSLLKETSRNIGLGLEHLTGGRVPPADDAEGHVLATRVVLESLIWYLKPHSEIRRELTTAAAHLTTALAAVAQQRLRVAAVVRHVQGHPVPVMLGTKWKKSTIASNERILDGALKAVWGLENLDPALTDVQRALQGAMETMHGTLIPGFADLEQDIEALRRSSKIPRVRFERPYESGRVDVVDRELAVDGIWVHEGPAGLLHRTGLRVFFLPPVEHVIVRLLDINIQKNRVDRAVKAQYEKENEVFSKWKSERFVFRASAGDGSGY